MEERAFPISWKDIIAVATCEDREISSVPPGHSYPEYVGHTPVGAGKVTFIEQQSSMGDAVSDPVSFQLFRDAVVRRI